MRAPAQSPDGVLHGYCTRGALPVGKAPLVQQTLWAILGSNQ